MMNSTESLVPRTTGLPVRIFGSSAMREGSLATWSGTPLSQRNFSREPRAMRPCHLREPHFETGVKNRAAGCDRPELLDAVASDADIPVVEVDGRVAVAGDQADLVADVEPVGGPP